MIPQFNKKGWLPPGIYEASLEEFEKRFVYNKEREGIYRGLVVLIADLKKVGCQTMYVDGSFVTSKNRPGDADVCWEVKHTADYMTVVGLIAPVLKMVKFPRREQKQRYCADVFPANAPADNLMTPFIKYFQQDKDTKKPKGIIKINFQ